MLTTEQINQKLEKAEQAFRDWKKLKLTERQKFSKKLANLLDERAETYGKIITDEMHKPISQAIAEVKKCALMTRWYAELPNLVLARKDVKTAYSTSEIHYEPLGVILGVMPWNFPFWQALRFAIPTVLAGNTIVLKHASICFGTGVNIEEAFRDAGFPEGIFQNLEVGHQAVEQILAFPAVQGVSLTGSEPAGASVASTAGKHIKKSVLELGGSDAFIVLEDADLDKAAEIGALARLQNCGETCIAAKRFIVHEKIADRFMPKFIEEYKKFVPGDPYDKATKIAGMARKDLADDLQRQYEFAKAHGAEDLIPLQRLDETTFMPGLIRVKEGNPILQEELFGPLGMVLIARDDEECLKIANDTKFGLANSVWTSNKEKAMHFARELESGVVTINDYTKSMPEMPFGGVKNSGFGSELSLNTLHEFTVPKSIVGNI